MAEWALASLKRLRYGAEIDPMPVAEPPPARKLEHEELSLTIDHTDEGWWAASFQGTGAFAQGRTREEALQNVLSALYDLGHEPTLRERALYRARALWANLRNLLPAR